MELNTNEDVFLLRLRNDVGLVMFSTANVFVLQSRLCLFNSKGCFAVSVYYFPDFVFQT